MLLSMYLYTTMNVPEVGAEFVQTENCSTTTIPSFNMETIYYILLAFLVFSVIKSVSFQCLRPGLSYSF